MDLTREIERAYREMQWTDFAATIEATIQELLAETDDQTPQQPQIHIEGYGWCTLVAPTANDPDSEESTAPQSQSSHPEGGDVSLNSFSGVPSTSRQPNNNAPLFPIPRHMGEMMQPIGILNGQIVYGSAGYAYIPPNSLAPPFDNTTKKRKSKKKQDGDQQQVKRPLNAFMIFRREQRPKVMAEFGIDENPLINKILGQRWKSLPKEVQARYYEEAQKEKFLHAQQHQDLSYTVEQSKTSKQAPSATVTSSIAAVAGPSTTQTVPGQPLQSQTGTVFPACDNSVIGLDDMWWQESQGEASTTTISPTTLDELLKFVERLESGLSTAQTDPEEPTSSTDENGIDRP